MKKLVFFSEAVKNDCNDTVGVNDVARWFGIPYTTLGRRVKTKNFY